MLTMLCGLLAADRPEHVVRILQGVLKSTSTYEHSLAAFAAASVRCLAELRRLDQEPVRTFALKLTDLLKQCSDVSLNHVGLLPAMRLAGERWPGASDLHAFAATINRTRQELIYYGIHYRLALATSTHTERTAVLEEILATWTGSYIFNAAVDEASLLSAWKADEVTRICRLAQRYGELTEAKVLGTLLQSGVHSATDRLCALMRSAPEPKARLEAAMALVRDEASREEALRTMLTLIEAPQPPRFDALRVLIDAFEEPFVRESVMAMLSSPNDEFRQMVAQALVEKGIPQAISVLEQYVRQSPPYSFSWRALNGLKRAAGSFDAAREALKRLLLDRGVAQPTLLVRLATWWAEHDYSDVAGRILKVFADSTPDESIQFEAFRALADICGHETDGWTMLMRLAREATNIKVRINATAALADVKQVSGAYERVQACLLEFIRPSNAESIRLYAAIGLAQHGTGSVAEQGRQALIALATSADNEQVRLLAAFRLVFRPHAANWMLRCSGVSRPAAGFCNLP